MAAFDPEGLIFATGINSECIKLYDLRSYDKGPFSSFLVDTSTSASAERDSADWAGLKFSPDGRSILVYTNGTAIRLIDAFKGHVTHTFGGHANDRGQALEASFSPDAQYLFSGSSDGKLHCWHIETGAKMVFSSEKHKGIVAGGEYWLALPVWNATSEGRRALRVRTLLDVVTIFPSFLFC